METKQQSTVALLTSSFPENARISLLVTLSIALISALSRFQVCMESNVIDINMDVQSISQSGILLLLIQWQNGSSKIPFDSASWSTHLHAIAAEFDRQMQIL